MQKDTFFIGDFNFNILIDNNNHSEFLNSIFGMSCYPLITKPFWRCFPLLVDD